MKTLRILGIRGVPAAHGGFETFAEHLALYLVDRGWRVIVYCQEDGARAEWQDVWQGIERIHIPVRHGGSLGTIVFDWKATAHASGHSDLCLTLGYNTAVFCARLKFKSVPNVINMDGIEWSRAKWGLAAKTWFWLNEGAGCWLGDHLIADHPKIKEHLERRVSGSKITVIPYGADLIESAGEESVKALGLTPGCYFTLIARPEPENSILEVVQGFSKRQRNVQLAVLGNFDDSKPYHREVKRAAGDEVRFLGAIYEKQIVQALRFHSIAYIHGHQVGGTNPSLVEALGAGNPVIAHDNRFNRWVAGPGAKYFVDSESFSEVIGSLIADKSSLQTMKIASRSRLQAGLTWPQVLQSYEELLLTYASGKVRGAAKLNY